jgi:xylulokinase
MSQDGDYILTIDIGTTNCRCVVLTSDGRVAEHGRASFAEQYPRPTWVEQNPEDWWTATVASVHQALASTALARERIVAISITGQMHGVLAVDEQGEVLTPCLMLRDRRATAEVEEIVHTLGVQRVDHITGAHLAPSLPVAN